jgi:hypothetical protein
MTTLLDPLEIPLTHRDFRSWMQDAGTELKRLDEKNYEIRTDYFRNSDDSQHELAVFDLKFELIGLKLAIAAVWALWKQVRDEMYAEV